MEELDKAQYAKERQAQQLAKRLSRSVRDNNVSMTNQILLWIEEGFNAADTNIIMTASVQFTRGARAAELQEWDLAIQHLESAYDLLAHLGSHVLGIAQVGKPNQYISLDA
jgi:hypothetical protein